MKNILYLINVDGKKIAFTNGREYIRFVNGNAGVGPIAKAIQVGLFDKDARAVYTGAMDKKTVYCFKHSECHAVAFTTQLARAVHAREYGLTEESFFEATCFDWLADVNEMLNKIDDEKEGC